jgi:branched-chain amino acid transport system permease protein
MLLFGVAMVFIMIVRPGGLISHRRATVSAQEVEAKP